MMERRLHALDTPTWCQPTTPILNGAVVCQAVDTVDTVTVDTVIPAVNPRPVTHYRYYCLAVTYCSTAACSCAAVLLWDVGMWYGGMVIRCSPALRRRCCVLNVASFALRVGRWKMSVQVGR